MKTVQHKEAFESEGGPGGRRLFYLTILIWFIFYLVVVGLFLYDYLRFDSDRDYYVGKYQEYLNQARTAAVFLENPKTKIDDNLLLLQDEGGRESLKRLREMLERNPPPAYLTASAVEFEKFYEVYDKAVKAMAVMNAYELEYRRILERRARAEKGRREAAEEMSRLDWFQGVGKLDLLQHLAKEYRVRIEISGNEASEAEKDFERARDDFQNYANATRSMLTVIEKSIAQAGSAGYLQDLKTRVSHLFKG